MGSIPREMVQTFERGLKTVESPFGRTRRSMAGLTNVWLAPDDFGALQAMPGYTKVNSSEITGATFHSTGAARHADGTRRRIVSYRDGSNNDFIVDVNPTTGAQTTLASFATSPAITVPDVSIVTMNDLVFFANGADAGFKVNAAGTLSASGVGRPDATTHPTDWPPTVALNAGGNNSVIGIVSYYISQITGTAEGASSAAIGPIDCGTGNRVDVDLTGATDFAGNTYRVYRTLADGVQPFLASQVAGNAVYTDDVPDAELTNRPWLHGDPPLAKIVSLTVFAQRVWGITDDSILVWADPKDPESWWNTSNGQYAPVNEDDGDEGVAVVNDTSGLFVFKKDHIYRILGANDPEFIDINEFEPVTQQGRNLGAPSENAIVGAHGSIAFYWNRGVYLMQGGAVRYISSDIEDDLAVIRGRDEEDGVYLGFHPKRRHLWVSLPLSAGVTPTHTYIYDVDLGQWAGRMDVGFRGFLSTFDANGDEQFWGCSANSGFIYLLENGVTAAGTAISTEAKLPVFVGHNMSTLKDLQYVKLEVAAQASGTIDVDVYEGGNSTPQAYTNLSLVKSGHDRWELTLHTPEVGMARQFQVAIKSNADQAQWKCYSVTYGFHEYKSVTR